MIRALLLGAVLIACLAASACGGDDESGATGSPTSGPSGAGAAGSGGAGTGGAAQSSAATGGAPGTSCAECVDGPWPGCGGDACKEDADCAAWTMCFDGCVQGDFDSKCFQACADAHPSSAMLREMLVDCVCTQCAMWCLPICAG